MDRGTVSWIKLHLESMAGDLHYKTITKFEFQVSIKTITLLWRMKWAEYVYHAKLIIRYFAPICASKSSANLWIHHKFFEDCMTRLKCLCDTQQDKNAVRSAKFFVTLSLCFTTANWFHTYGLDWRRTGTEFYLYPKKTSWKGNPINLDLYLPVSIKL